ncbi:MAG: hypothetical protein V5A37_05570 [Halobacteriales archaeon]
MPRPEHAAGAGALACLATAVAVAVPYILLADAAVVPRYYGLGLVGPLAVALLALVGFVAFAAGARERSDPSLVAGLVLVAGVASLAVAVQWALAFDGATLGTGPATYGFFDVHRWVVVAGTAVWTLAAGWYAASLGLLGSGPE